MIRAAVVGLLSLVTPATGCAPSDDGTETGVVFTDLQSGDETVIADGANDGNLTVCRTVGVGFYAGDEEYEFMVTVDVPGADTGDTLEVPPAVVEFQPPTGELGLHLATSGVVEVELMADDGLQKTRRMTFDVEQTDQWRVRGTLFCLQGLFEIDLGAPDDAFDDSDDDSDSD